MKILTPIKKRVKDIKPGDIVTIPPHQKDPATVKEVGQGYEAARPVLFENAPPVSVKADTVVNSYVHEEEEAEYISVTDTAKIIRRILKKNFPDAKFWVRSKSYSGGASVGVYWIDGPSKEEVKEKLLPLEGKSFDGSIDMACYDYTWLLPDGSVRFAKSEGTEGSMGFIPASESPRPHPEARLISSGADSIRYNHAYTREELEKRLQACRNDNPWIEWVPELYESSFYIGSTEKGTVYNASLDNWGDHGLESKEYQKYL